MFRDHLRLTTQEAVARIQGKWAADVRAYDKIHVQILRDGRHAFSRNRAAVPAAVPLATTHRSDSRSEPNRPEVAEATCRFGTDSRRGAPLQAAVYQTASSL